jgi:toxin ParE1/3/4
MALADFPQRGTRRDDLSPGLRTVGFERRATIAFRVLPTRVEFITIAYGGRDFERDLRDE